MCDRGNCGRSRGRSSHVEVKYVKSVSSSHRRRSSERWATDYNKIGCVTGGSIAAYKCCSDRSCGGCSKKAGDGHGHSGGSRGGCGCGKDSCRGGCSSRRRSRSRSSERGCCAKKPCKKKDCKKCNFEVIIKQRRGRSSSRGRCGCRKPSCEKCGIEVIVKQASKSCRRRSPSPCGPRKVDCYRGGAGGCGSGRDAPNACGGCCMRQVEPACLLKVGETCGAQYAQPCTTWNVTNVPCSPCGQGCGGENSPCVTVV